MTRWLMLALLAIGFWFAAFVFAWNPESISPIPIPASDIDEYRAAVQFYSEAMTHFRAVRWHACLAAGVTEQECGQPDPSGRGFVMRLPKPETKPATGETKEPKSETP